MCQCLINMIAISGNGINSGESANDFSIEKNCKLTSNRDEHIGKCKPVFGSISSYLPRFNVKENISCNPIPSSKHLQAINAICPAFSCKQFSINVPLLNCTQAAERPITFFLKPDAENRDLVPLPVRSTAVVKAECPPDPCTADEWDEYADLNESLEILASTTKKKKHKWWKSFAQSDKDVGKTEITVKDRLASHPGQKEVEFAGKITHEVSSLDKTVKLTTKDRKKLDDGEKVGPQGEGKSRPMPKVGGAFSSPCGTMIAGGPDHNDWMVNERMKKITEIRDNHHDVRLSKKEMECLNRVRRPSQGYVEDTRFLAKLQKVFGHEETKLPENNQIEFFDISSTQESTATAGKAGLFDGVKKLLLPWLGGEKSQEKLTFSSPTQATPASRGDYLTSVRASIAHTIQKSVRETVVPMAKKWQGHSKLILLMFLVVPLSYVLHRHWDDIMKLIAVWWSNLLELLSHWWMNILDFAIDIWRAIMDYLDCYPEIIAIIGTVIFLVLLATYFSLRRQFNELEEDIKLSESFFKEPEIDLKKISSISREKQLVIESFVETASRKGKQAKAFLEDEVKVTSKEVENRLLGDEAEDQVESKKPPVPDNIGRAKTTSLPKQHPSDKKKVEKVRVSKELPRSSHDNKIEVNAVLTKKVSTNKTALPLSDKGRAAILPPAPKTPILESEKFPPRNGNSPQENLPPYQDKSPHPKKSPHQEISHPHKKYTQEKLPDQDRPPHNGKSPQEEISPHYGKPSQEKASHHEKLPHHGKLSHHGKPPQHGKPLHHGKPSNRIKSPRKEPKWGASPLRRAVPKLPHDRETLAKEKSFFKRTPFVHGDLGSFKVKYPKEKFRLSIVTGV